MKRTSSSTRKPSRARSLVGLLLFGVALSALAAEEDYAAIFGTKYDEAEQFLRQNSWIADFLYLPPLETRIALAVVFPEIIRFRVLEDRLQIRALKVLYVQYGRKYADFSVGQFQMKPTFTEQVERDYNRLFSDEEKAATAIPAFATGDSSGLRKERVLRLDDVRWQVRYLRLFMMVMGKLYGDQAFDDGLEKLRFYATAYTAGYAKGEKTIRRMMRAKHFHVQLFFPKARYNYADIAVFYFDRHTKAATRVPRPAGDLSELLELRENAPGRTRTSDTGIRNPLLYPY